jgi:hypothetical protein
MYNYSIITFNLLKINSLAWYNKNIPATPSSFDPRLNLLLFDHRL